jgi:hypothetical protein
LGLMSNSISLLYSNRGDEEKKMLFKAAFDRFKDSGKPIRLGGHWINDTLSD